MFFNPFDTTTNELLRLKEELDNEFYGQRRTVIACKHCNTTLQDFLDTGFVGCMKCYEVFQRYAEDVALDIHGRIGHVGKVPKQEFSKTAKKRELERLLREEDIAVKNRDYRYADELKNRIDRLREELKW